MAPARVAAAALLACLSGCGSTLPGMSDGCHNETPAQARCAEYQIPVCAKQRCGPWHRKVKACHCVMRAFVQASR